MRNELETLQAEIDRLNAQLVLWSKANLAIIKKLSDTERDNGRLRAELALLKADLESAKTELERFNEMDCYVGHET